MQSFDSAQIRSLRLLTILSGVLLVATAGRLAAQQHTDAQEGRSDAMFGMPDRYGVTPQDNIFATTPGLEQQARRSTFTFNILALLSYNSNALLPPSGVPTGQNSAEFSPIVGLSSATPVFDLPFRFHGERARRGRSLTYSRDLWSVPALQ